jgi:hypothetical protein
MSDRLFRDASERHKVADDRQREEELLHCVDAVTGQVLYQPLVARRSTGVNAVATQQQRDEALSHGTVRDYAVNTSREKTPFVGEYSRVLADLRHARDGGGDTVFARLSHEQPRREPLVQASSFTPRINETSRAMDHHGGVDRVAVLLEQHAQYAAHRDWMAQDKAQHELDECTWQPRLSRGGGAVVAQGSFLDRQANWDAKRGAKLNGQRQQLADHELAGCTFTPVTAV